MTDLEITAGEDRRASSDAILTTAVRQMLDASGRTELSRLYCAACDGEVVLCGTVPTDSLKLTAVQLVSRLATVRRVSDYIEVAHSC
ncbi:BON domain-containing protein [Blastopirellula sp. JC732]|uniref:BON domain-containing protein n=1 Tax=Blastopirellula sediminis TaxID=2894196 RepID=A0A9X1SFQ9_9BACT|nr:BON domain-containing protein [Blastopirellula sediminis]MCC9628017.1 BON domain-containing protein [Blastopirellula sediminis]